NLLGEDLGLLNSKELEQQLKPSLKHVHSTKTGQAMANALNVVQTSHSYGDLMLLMKAAELQQERPWSYMVEMARIELFTNHSTLIRADMLNCFYS
ncbi:hypothetical protein ERO13_D02G138950v2, partial [Gossypium hirsutum]